MPDGGLDLAFEADAAERAAVAAATDAPGIDALAARFNVRPRAGGRFAVRGEVTAVVTETCVVSLDPFPMSVAQAVDLVFAPATEAASELPGLAAPREDRRNDRERREGVATVPGSDEQPDPPDPIVDGIIDLGAVAVEFLQLARDPYPRKPDARFDDVVAAEAAEVRPSPFAALSRLKDRS